MPYVSDWSGYRPDGLQTFAEKNMDYNFIRFEEKPRSLLGKEPYVSIFGRGKIYLNRRTLQLLGEPDAIALFYDDRRSVIGIQAVAPSRHFAFRLQKKDKRSLSSTIAANGFFKHHSLQPDGNLVFRNPTLNDNGILVLDLNDVDCVSKKSG